MTNPTYKIEWQWSEKDYDDFTEEEIRRLANQDPAAKGHMKALIEACQKWVAKRPQYRPGTLLKCLGRRIIITENGPINDDGHPYTGYNSPEQWEVLYEPPELTVRDHLHAFGMDDKMIRQYTSQTVQVIFNDPIVEACKKAEGLT